MDREIQNEVDAKLLRARKRSVTYCHKCNGDLSREESHPLGLPLVILQCPSCGNEETRVKEGGVYKKAGRKPRRFEL